MSSQPLNSLPTKPDRNSGPVDQVYFDRQWDKLVTAINPVIDQTNTNTEAITSQPSTAPSTAPTITPYVPKGTRTAVTGPLGVARSNSTKYTMNVIGYSHEISGGSTGTIVVLINGVQKWGQENSATVAGKPVGWNFDVLPGESYQINSTGDIAGTPDSWEELTYS